jgi:hypothetical protein
MSKPGWAGPFTLSPMVNVSRCVKGGCGFPGVALGSLLSHPSHPGVCGWVLQKRRGECSFEDSPLTFRFFEDLVRAPDHN